MISRVVRGENYHGMALKARYGLCIYGLLGYVDMDDAFKPVIRADISRSYSISLLDISCPPCSFRPSFYPT